MDLTVFTVATGDLRRALDAVRRHADKTKTGGDGDATCHRVRLLFEPQAGELRVVATNLVTAAAAVVKLLDPTGGQLDIFSGSDDDGKTQPRTSCDLDLVSVSKVLKVFPKDGSEDGLTRIQVDDNGPTFRHAGGLFDGEALELLSAGGGGSFPDVWAAIRKAALAAQSTPSPKPLTAAGSSLAAFEAASKLYETPLTVLPSGTPESRGFVVQCGPLFLGTISSAHNDGDSLGRRDAAAQVWLRRFEGKTLADVTS
jgi:hypothetical protein